MLIKEIFQNDNHEMEFVTVTGKVHVSKDRNMYNSIKKKYALIAGKVTQLYSQRYAQYEKADDILNKSYDDFYTCAEIAVVEVKNDLISMDRYDLDDGTILKYIEEHEYFESFYSVNDEINEMIMEVYGDLEANKQYRQARKDSRARWTGGTIGGSMMDAYAQQMQIGVMNANDWALHSIANAVGNATDKIKANALLKSIFNDKANKENLLRSVYNSILNLHMAIIDMLEEYTDTQISDIPNEKECDMAQRLLNNIESNSIPQDKINELYIQILELNPYNLGTYISMLKRYSDKENQLGTLAKYFSVDLENEKDSIALEYVKANKGETEEDAHNAKVLLIDYCKEISLDVSDDHKCMKYINKRLYDFDLEYRTVDGVVCETRDGADFARQELTEIQKFMEDIKEPESDSLLDYEMGLLKKKEEFDKLFQSEIKSKYIAVMDEYLKDFDDTFCRIGLLKKADRKTAGKKRLLDRIKGLKPFTIDEIEKAYEQMRELLPKVGLEETEADETLAYLEKCKDNLALAYVKENQGETEEEAIAAKEKMIAYCEEIGLVVKAELESMKYIESRLNKFDLEYRTVDKIECSTRESADFAREELQHIQEFMVQVVEPDKNSLLDYEQELLDKKKKFDETFNSELKERYLQIFDKYLSDFDKKFCSVGLLKKAASRKEAGIYRASTYVKGLKITSQEEYEKAYAQLKDLLPKLGITEEEASDSFAELEKKKANIGKSILSGLFKK